jgi:hypothetical protein
MLGMPSGSTVRAAALGVLVLALLAAVVVLVARARASGTLPTSAATARTFVPDSTPAPTATPTDAPTPAPTAAQGGGGSRPSPTGQTILSFGVPQTIQCDHANQTTPSVHLTWRTANATGVSISIDGPGKFADYPAGGSADLPFACSVAQHTYLITTQGTGAPATRTVVVKRVTA